MVQLKGWLRIFITTLCLVVSVAAMLNVFADNADVLAQAKGIACPSGPCDPSRGERTPFAQTFEFRTTAGPITVRCARGAILFGEYACSKP
jgi:hypothetical protein